MGAHRCRLLLPAPGFPREVIPVAVRWYLRYGLSHTLALTFTKAGTFPYVDVGDFVLGMQASAIVAP
jgi:hypothetical protein